MNEKTKTILKIVISIVLIVISGYFSVKDISFEELADDVINANYFWVIISIPIILLAHVLRAWRWKTMLKPIIDAKSIYNLFKAVMIGYAANSVTPRGGELLRPYSYARQENVSFTSVFATIIVERFLDILTLLSLFALSLILFNEKINSALTEVMIKLGDGTSSTINLNSIIFISAILLIVIIFAFYPPIAEFLLKIFVKPFSKKYYEKFVTLFEKFRVGFGIIKKPREYVRIIIQSLLIWVCYGLPMYLMFFSFDFQSRLDLGADDAFLLLIVVGIAVTIAPTPGAVGVHHVAVRWAMMALYAKYGLTMKEALAYAIITHGINYIVNSLVGGYYYVRLKKKIPQKGEIEAEISKEAL
ncbi:MAG: lysylphosphatidylglycerol synthase transmembrane domain-containing protein [Candidatus Woesearchaeota archaeon]